MPNSTIIVLNESKHARSYSSSLASDNTNRSRLIHKAEFEKVLDLIEECIPRNDEEAERTHLHNTITVLGSRGSGKTSFLLSIRDEIKPPKGPYGNSKLQKEIQVLDIIDPTLIEEKGHVFLNVIARIIDLVNEKFDLVEFGKNWESETAFSRNEWRSSLNRLASGLPSIDGIGTGYNDGWQDPEFVMDNGLIAVASSLKLAENFNCFLKISLRILKRKAFLLMFDDIDVDSSKGWAVLETIRKYFTGTRLITIISGDIQLYSTVVRQKKWQNFGKEILKYEGERLNRIGVFNNVITELESQYLQKVLRPGQRIHLTTLAERKLYSSQASIYVYRETKDVTLNQLDPNKEIIELYTRILKYFGINNKYQAKAYINFLLGLPLRSQLQFLSLFDFNTADLIDETSGGNTIVDVFVSDLYAKNMDSNNLNKVPKDLNRIVLRFLLNERKIEELYQLQPITTDKSLNASLLTFNFLLSFHIQRDPYLIFDFFIKIGYIRNLLPIIGYRNENNKGGPSLEDLCENTVILNDNVLKDIVGRIIAYVRGTIEDRSPNSERVSRAGTIPLFGEASKAKKGATSVSDRIDSVLKNKGATFVESLLVYIPLSSNQYVYKQSSLLTYSSFLLLGAIGELCRISELDSIDRGLIELSQLRGYMMPNFKRGAGDISEIEEKPEDPVERPSPDFAIEKAFYRWVKTYPREIKVSVHLLGKISTRFYYAITNLENKVGSKKLGDIFHAHILAFLNAVLIEDCRENMSSFVALNLNNTNYNDRIFTENLKKIINSGEVLESLRFSRWMLGCPLLLAYIKKDDEDLIRNISDFCKTQDYSVTDSLSLNLSRFLDEIPIKNEDGPVLPVSLYMKNYALVEYILKQNSFDTSLLNSLSFKQVVKMWSDFGISQVTAPNLRRFKNYLNNKGS